MLEKYLAPWGNKVPWINKVIKLEDQFCKALARIASLTAEYARLQKDFRRLMNDYDALQSDYEDLREREYQRYTLPKVEAMGSRIMAGVVEHERVEIDSIEVRYQATMGHICFEHIGASEAKKYFYEDFVRHRGRAAKDMADVLLMKLEEQLKAKGLL